MILLGTFIYLEIYQGCQNAPYNYCSVYPHELTNSHEAETFLKMTEKPPIYLEIISKVAESTLQLLLSLSQRGDQLSSSKTFLENDREPPTTTHTHTQLTHEHHAFRNFLTHCQRFLKINIPALTFIA